MKSSKAVIAILLSTIWISISEFTRNQVLFAKLWKDHYSNLGLFFPDSPMNGAIWGVWSLCLAIATFFISKKFSLIQTTLITWLTAFVMMWLVIGNLNVLPFKLLIFAIPLSILEAFLATLIINMFKKKE